MPKKPQWTVATFERPIELFVGDKVDWHIEGGSSESYLLLNQIRLRTLQSDCVVWRVVDLRTNVKRQINFPGNEQDLATRHWMQIIRCDTGEQEQYFSRNGCSGPYLKWQDEQSKK